LSLYFLSSFAAVLSKLLLSGHRPDAAMVPHDDIENGCVAADTIHDTSRDPHREHRMGSGRRGPKWSTYRSWSRPNRSAIAAKSTACDRPVIE
jgi:hypothetical protein